MPTVTNIAAYHFAPLTGREALRAHLQQRCAELELKGTILLAAEGLNCFLAGTAEAIDEILAELRRIPGLESLEAKFSQSDRQPFRRMLVKLKSEIIPFGQPQINPALRPAPRLTATELKQWLDDGREVILLDTRNDYEVRLGTFEQAIDPHLQHFRDFPRAAAELPADLRDKPIVTFCTGGIRCEKAAPWMLENGFREVYQLEGGILKYFEEVGGAHWQGECFVFDRRVALDPALQETATEVCWACQEPLTLEEQRDPRYRQGEQCPRCAVTPE